MNINSDVPLETIIRQKQSISQYEKILDHPEIMTKIETFDDKLLKYFSDNPNFVKELIKYITIIPPDPQNYKRSHKYPFISSQIFESEPEQILKVFFSQDESYKYELFKFLKQDTQLNDTLVGYFSNLVLILIGKCPLHMTTYIFLQIQVFQNLMKHMRNYFIKQLEFYCQNYLFYFIYTFNSSHIDNDQISNILCAVYILPYKYPDQDQSDDASFVDVKLKYICKLLENFNQLSQNTTQNLTQILINIIRTYKNILGGERLFTKIFSQTFIKTIFHLLQSSDQHKSLTSSELLINLAQLFLQGSFQEKTVYQSYIKTLNQSCNIISDALEFTNKKKLGQKIVKVIELISLLVQIKDEQITDSLSRNNIIYKIQEIFFRFSNNSICLNIISQIFTHLIEFKHNEQLLEELLKSHFLFKILDKCNESHNISYGSRDSNICYMITISNQICNNMSKLIERYLPREWPSYVENYLFLSNGISNFDLGDFTILQKQLNNESKTDDTSSLYFSPAQYFNNSELDQKQSVNEVTTPISPPSTQRVSNQDFEQNQKEFKIKQKELNKEDLLVIQETLEQMIEAVEYNVKQQQIIDKQKINNKQDVYQDNNKYQQNLLQREVIIENKNELKQQIMNSSREQSRESEKRPQQFQSQYDRIIQIQVNKTIEQLIKQIEVYFTEKQRKRINIPNKVQVLQEIEVLEEKSLMNSLKNSTNLSEQRQSIYHDKQLITSMKNSQIDMKDSTYLQQFTKDSEQQQNLNMILKQLNMQTFQFFDEENGEQSSFELDPAVEDLKNSYFNINSIQNYNEDEQIQNQRTSQTNRFSNLKNKMIFKPIQDDSGQKQDNQQSIQTNPILLNNTGSDHKYRSSYNEINSKYVQPSQNYEKIVQILDDSQKLKQRIQKQNDTQGFEKNRYSKQYKNQQEILPITTSSLNYNSPNSVPQNEIEQTRSSSLWQKFSDFESKYINPQRFTDNVQSTGFKNTLVNRPQSEKLFQSVTINDYSKNLLDDLQDQNKKEENIKYSYPSIKNPHFKQ